MNPVWVVGLMSGTSLDGIDAAALYTDGIEVKEFGPGLTVPYSRSFRERLRGILGCHFYTPEIHDLERELTALHATAVNALLPSLNHPPQLIGFHGHTIFHQPPKTWQLGDGQLLANLVNIPVVYNFRHNDCLEGGQGAPLIPVYHQALCRRLEKPLCVVNIGGVANITAIDNDELIAFDTGPGNALLDDLVHHQFLLDYDKDGAIAASGHIVPGVIETWLQHPYFHRPYPKSLDRNDFQLLVNKTVFTSAADKLATLTAFTAASIVLAIKQLPFSVKRVLICGGGRKNKTLMHCLDELLPDKIIKDIDYMKWDGDLLEAQGFGYMAVRKVRELPISFPLTTGVKESLTGGEIARPDDFTG